MFITHMFVFWGYSAFTLYLLATGEITRFISPRLVWLAYFSGFSLGLFLCVLFLRLDKVDDSAVSRKTVFREIVKGILFVYPLILFFMFNPSDISAVNTPAVKEIPLKRPAIKKSAPASLPVDMDGYVRLNLFELWLLAKNYPEMAQRYKIKTIGMVSKSSEKYLTLSRLFMTCCAADATPVEVEIATPSARNDRVGVQSFNKGDWLEVSGSIIIRDYVIIIPDSINILPKQTDSYITRWSERPPFNP